jgi:O-antigen/teichoic acid export membrane protein
LLNTWFKLPKMDSLKGLQLVQLVRYGSMFGIGVVFVKAGISKATIGNFESLIFLAAAVSFFWITGIIQSLLPLYDSDNPNTTLKNGKKGSELFNAFALLIFFSALSALLILILGNWLTDFLDAEMGHTVIYFLAAYVFLQGPSSLTEYIYLLRKESRKMLWYGWSVFGFQFLIVSIAALLPIDFIWVLYALVISVAIRFVWVIIELFRVSIIRISWEYIRQHLALGVPIIISVLLSGSAQYVDSWIIKSHYDQSVFVVFRYGARELPFVALLAHALSSAIIPEISRLGPVKGLKVLKERTTNLANWLFPVSLLFILASYLLFPLMYSDGFLESAKIFNIYVLLIMTRLVFPQSIMIAYKKTSFLMVASALELVLNIGLSLYFIQIWGIIGVAYATLLAYVFERLVLIVYTRIILGLRLSNYLNIPKHLIWSLILIGAFVFVELFLGDYWISLFS